MAKTVEEFELFPPFESAEDDRNDNLLKKADIPSSVKNRTADSPRKKSRNNSVKGRNSEGTPIFSSFLIWLLGNLSFPFLS